MRRTIGLPRALLIVVALAWQGGAVDIVLRPEVRYQTIVGFGGHNPRDQTSTLVNDLGLSAHRAEIQCNSSVGSTPGWAMLREMKDAGVECFIASPWSPPPSMKYVNNCSGTDKYWNRLSNGLGPGNDYLHPTLDPEKGGKRNYYPDFATHLANYAKQFRSNVGIDLAGISPQNEPAFAQSYSSCVYNESQYRDLVLEVGRKFSAEGLSGVKIFGSEDMLSAFGGRPFIQRLMADTAVARYMGAVAVHGYSDGVNPSPTSQMASLWGGRSGAGTFARAKGLPCWMTETSGYRNWLGYTSSTDTLPGGLHLGAAILGALKYGKVSGWWWWRLAVTESYWEDEALIYNGQKLKTYYASKHFYKYIRPGAVMVHVNDSADTSIGVVAFHHEQNRTLTVVAVNVTAQTKTLRLSGPLPSGGFAGYLSDGSRNWSSQGTVTEGSFSLPGQSIVTLYATNYAPVVSVKPAARESRSLTQLVQLAGEVEVYRPDGRFVLRLKGPDQIGILLGARPLPAGSYYLRVVCGDAPAVVQKVSYTR